MRIALWAARLAALTALIALGAAPALARPEYARKEKKNCAYCHVNPNGGGARNPRGLYYAAHNKSFVGYDEAKVMGAPAAAVKPGALSYKAAWKVDVPAGTSRIAAADVAGDMKSRLLALGEGHTLVVLDVGGSTPKQEAALDLGEQAKSFVAGNFAKGKPAVIVAPGVVYYRDGDKYSKKTIADLEKITGTVRFADGVENFFFFGGSMPDVYAIDLAGDKALVTGRDMPAPDQGAGVYNELVARLPIELLGALGVPEDAQRVGAVGFLDPRSDGKWYTWIPMQGKDASYLVIANPDAISPTGQGAELKPEWKSPKLTGKLLDVALGRNPRDPKKAGFFTLQATGDDGKGRIVEFWEIE